MAFSAAVQDRHTELRARETSLNRLRALRAAGVANMVVLSVSPKVASNPVHQEVAAFLEPVLEELLEELVARAEVRVKSLLDADQAALNAMIDAER